MAGGVGRDGGLSHDGFHSANANQSLCAGCSINHSVNMLQILKPVLANIFGVVGDVLLLEVFHLGNHVL